MTKQVKSKSPYWAEFEYDFSMDKDIKHNKLIVQRQFSADSYNIDYSIKNHAFKSGAISYKRIDAPE